MNYGDAIKSLTDGNLVRRSGWNGKGQFVIYVPPSIGVQLRPGSPYHNALGDGTVDIGGHFDLFNAQGYFQPGWIASMGDTLAEDWETLEDE